jgi:hypothetical protein
MRFKKAERETARFLWFANGFFGHIFFSGTISYCVTINLAGQRRIVFPTARTLADEGLMRNSLGL